MKRAKQLLVLTCLLCLCATASWGEGFLGSLNTTGYVGVASFSYQIQFSQSATFGATPLPGGLFLDGSQIIGTPTTEGAYSNIVLTATDISDTQFTTNLTVVILPATPPPVITSDSSDIGYINDPYGYTIVASNATGYGALNLPPGWTVNSASGLISGTPTVVEQRAITLIASNATSIPGQKILMLTILQTDATNRIFSEDFEGSFPSGWQVGDANAAGTPAYWGAVSSPFAGLSARSGSQMAYCAGIGYGGTSDSPTYRNNMRAYLQRTFDLSGSSAVTLSFNSRILDSDTGLDYCNVLVSTDGTSWVNVWHVSRVDGDWTSETVALNQYAGKPGVIIRFEFDADAYVNGIGWFLDNIELFTGQGDRFDNAPAVIVSTNYTGVVATKNALDVTHVRLRQGYTYVITAIGSTLGDPQMWLFDTNRIQLAYNNDGSGLGINSRITWNCAATGDYYIQVSGYSGDTGAYKLLVTEQTPVADIQAVSVAMTLPVGDPRGLPPATLTYELHNNGPMSLNNGVSYNYQVDIFLSADGTRTGAGTGVLLGSQTNQLALATGASFTNNVMDDNLLASYTLPSALQEGSYFVWLHIRPLSGSPTDSTSTNNWKVSAAVTVPHPDRVDISGIVTKSGGAAGMGGVVLTLDPPITNDVVTDALGNYQVPNLPYNWSGTITPSTSNGVAGRFSPSSWSYPNATNAVTNNLVSQNFAWTPPPLIAGKVTRVGTSTGVAGVKMMLTGGSVTNYTDVNGNYTIIVSNGWSGSIWPTLELAGSFSPGPRGYTDVIANRTAQNYTWSASAVISGQITKTGTNTVLVAFVGGSVATNVPTDRNGYYSYIVPYGWTGTVTPTNSLGGAFSAANKAFSKLTASKSAQNFSWTPPPVISGRVTCAGVAKTNVLIAFIGNGVTKNVPTDSNGYYSNVVAYGWTGRVEPSVSGSGGTFTPRNKFYSNVIANKTAQNFTWMAPAVPHVVSVAATEVKRGSSVVEPASDLPAGRPTAGVAVEPARLLHTTGRIRWSGADAQQVRQSPAWLTVALVDGVVQVVPVVPVVAAGDMTTALEFMAGLTGLVATANGDLVVVRNVNGIPVTDAVLTGTTVQDAVMFLTPGQDAILTWDLSLMRP